MKSIPGFTLKKLIHSSRFSQVYRANRIADGQSVILRTLNIDNLCSDQFKRLSKSRRLLEKFNHPNVVKVEGWLATGHGPVLVLEDIGGIDLFQYQSQQPDNRLSLAVFFEVALQLCDCLAEIHGKGIVHKDLHLGNIIIEPISQRLQVIDFDLSDRLLYQGVALRKSRRVKGAIHFLSPELTGRLNMSADHRVDFYSMGVCLYRLLTGKKPVQGDQLDEVVHNVLAGDIRNISEHQPDIPTMLVKLINKLMAVNPDHRYNTAQGIKSDLECCYEYWRTTQSIPIFELATRDRPGFFKWADRFYGREEELETLARWLTNDHVKLLSVAGEPGVGKTALTEQLLMAYYRQHQADSLIFKTKLKEEESAVSYQLIRGLLEDWLISNNVDIDLSRELLTEQLAIAVDSQSAQILVNILAPRDTVKSHMDSADHQHEVLGSGFSQKLVSAVKHWLLAVAEHKRLILVVDDVQWADAMSCEVLKHLLCDSDLAIRLVVLFRNQSSDYVQPYNDIQSAMVADQVRHLSVQPFRANQVFDLLTLELDIDPHTAESLTPLLMQRTVGYPLYIREYMLSAYYSGHMTFHYEAQQWRINLPALAAEPVTDEMAEIIHKRIADLSGDCLEVLRLAACTGFEFKERFIVELLGRDQAEDTQHQLAWAAACGVLLVLDQRLERSDFQFSHDRLREAIYDSIPQSIRAMLHRSIARQLYTDWQMRPTTRLLDQLVNQYNLAVTKVTEPDELLIVADLNRRAAEYALRIGAWHRALECSQAGLAMVSSKHQRYRDEVFLELSLIQAETEFLIGDKAQSHALFKRLVSSVQSLQQGDEDKTILLLRIQRTRFILCMAVLDWSSAYQVGLETLAMDEFSHIIGRSAKGGFPPLNTSSLIAQLENLPFVANPSVESQLSFLANLSQFALVNQCTELLHITNQLSVELLLEFGHGALSPLVIANVAAEQVSEGNYCNALMWSHLVDRLVEQKPEIIDASTLNILAGLVAFYGDDLHEVINKHIAGVAIGFNRGEVLRALMNHSNSLFIKYFSAMPLSELKRQAAESKALCDEMAVNFPVAKDYLQLIDVLSHEVLVTGKETVWPQDEALVHKGFEAVKLPYILSSTNDRLQAVAMRLGISPQLDTSRTRNIHSRHQLYFLLVKHFWCGDIARVREIALVMHQRGILTSGFIISVDAYVLILLSLTSAELTPHEMALLEYVVTQLTAIYDAGAEHFAFIKPLIDAELGALGRKYEDGGVVFSEQGTPLPDAMANYSLAIDKAHISGFLHYEGLMNQRLGEFWLNEGMDQYGYLHIKRAYALYQQWQNMAAVSLLEQEYPQLFASYEVPIELLSSISLGSSQYLQ